MTAAPHIRMTDGTPLLAGLAWSPATQGALPAPGPGRGAAGLAKPDC